MRITVAEALVQIMSKEGINTAFGIPGAAINPVYKYLQNAPIAHYVMRHEEACVHAADGYFRANHEIALAICSAGPGATNFVTGLYTAFIDSMPVLAVVGQANSNQLTQEPFQCVDMTEIAKTVTKKAWSLKKAEELPSIMQEAFYQMRSGRKGPVLVELPLDLQKTEFEFDINDYQSKQIETCKPNSSDISKAISMLKQAVKPVIILGGGCVLSHCTNEVVEFAQKYNIPVISTFMAKGAIEESNPINAGHCGIQVGQPIGNSVMLESDFVLAIGNRFCDRHTGDIKVYKGERKFVHINIEPSQIGMVFDPDLAIISDAKLAIEALTVEADKQELKAFCSKRIESIVAMKKQLERKTDYPNAPIMPHRVFKEINDCFDDSTYFTVGCGITQIWSGQLQKINRVQQYLPSGGAGTLGYEIPALFGVKVAKPDNIAVTVVGDFGLTFMGEEIAVASVYQKPLIIIVLNNAYLGLIRQNQLGAYGFEYAVDMPYNQDGTIDYVKLGEAYGCKAERVFTPDGLKAAILKAKQEVVNNKRCYLIDAICVKTQLCDMGNSIDKIKDCAPKA